LPIDATSKDVLGLEKAKVQAKVDKRATDLTSESDDPDKTNIKQVLKQLTYRPSETERTFL